MGGKKVTVIVLLLVLSISTIVGCSNKISKVYEQKEQETIIGAEEALKEEHGVKINEDSVIFTDVRNKEITLNKHPERVVVLFNSYLDIWVNSGGTVIGKLEESEDKVVEGAENAEVVGREGAISLEKILSLQPDLVILNGNSSFQMEFVPILEDNGIGVIALDYINKEDYFKFVRLFTALNEREDLYEENGLKVKEEIEEIIAKVPTDKNYKVLLMMASSKTIKAYESNSYVGEMLKDLHTTNIANISNGTLNDTNFSLEKIIEEDPDFIFISPMGSDMEKITDKLKKDVESNPAWSSLKAVKEDKYIFLPKDLYRYKANDRYVEAYEKLAEYLYPDTFK